LICAQCCGEKRILEIDCPESCEYLQVGRAHEAALENARHLMSSDPQKQQKRARIIDRFHLVIAHLEYVIGRERRASKSLTDPDVAEALDLLLETYRTEDRGVIYEHTSSNLRVDAFRRQLREVVESYRNPNEGQREALRLRDSLDCLELVRDLVGSHMALRESETSYVDFLARTAPRGQELETPGSSLIVPGS
jgi:hypothetical protein